MIGVLKTPTDHKSWYDWSVVLWAHAVVGILLLLPLAYMTGEWKAWAGLISGLYLWWWERSVQKWGAGLRDSLVDWFGVSSGLLIVGFLLDLEVGRATYAALGLVAVTAVGAWRRR